MTQFPLPENSQESKLSRETKVNLLTREIENLNSLYTELKVDVSDITFIKQHLKTKYKIQLVMSKEQQEKLDREILEEIERSKTETRLSILIEMQTPVDDVVDQTNISILVTRVRELLNNYSIKEIEFVEYSNEEEFDREVFTVTQKIIIVAVS